MGASGFQFDPAFNASASSGMCTVIHEERGLRLTVIHRFPFSSALKRMTVVVHRKEDDSLWVFCKGAPEVQPFNLLTTLCSKESSITISVGLAGLHGSKVSARKLPIHSILSHVPRKERHVVFLN